MTRTSLLCSCIAWILMFVAIQGAPMIQNNGLTQQELIRTKRWSDKEFVSRDLQNNTNNDGRKMLEAARRASLFQRHPLIPSYKLNINEQLPFELFTQGLSSRSQSTTELPISSTIKALLKTATLKVSSNSSEATPTFAPSLSEVSTLRNRMLVSLLPRRRTKRLIDDRSVIQQQQPEIISYPSETQTYGQKTNRKEQAKSSKIASLLNVTSQAIEIKVNSKYRLPNTSMDSNGTLPFKKNETANNPDFSKKINSSKENIPDQNSLQYKKELFADSNFSAIVSKLARALDTAISGAIGQLRLLSDNSPVFTRIIHAVQLWYSQLQTLINADLSCNNSLDASCKERLFNDTEVRFFTESMADSVSSVGHSFERVLHRVMRRLSRGTSALVSTLKRNTSVRGMIVFIIPSIMSFIALSELALLPLPIAGLISFFTPLLYLAFYSAK